MNTTDIRNILVWNPNSRRLDHGKGRLAFVDIAKCIALALLIVSHGEAYYLFEFYDVLWLPVFWICAGYTSAVDFSLKKKFRLLGYYLFMNLICVLFSVTYAGDSITWTDLWGILYARYYIGIAPGEPRICYLPLFNAALWFIPSLITTYCIYKILLIPRTFKGRTLMCVASLAIATGLDQLPVLLPWTIDGAFVFAVFMCFGRWLRQYDVINRAGFLVMAACVILFFCLSDFTGLTNPSIRIYGHHWPSFLLTSMAGVTGVLLICRYFERTWIGRIAVWFDSEAIFTFGLQLIVMKVYYDYIAFTFENWKIRVLLCILSCFIIGWLVGKFYRLSIKGIGMLIRRDRT